MNLNTDIIVKSFYAVDLKAFAMPIITVYENPKDYPNKYVARMFNLNMPTNIIMVKDTVEEIRKGIPQYYSKILPTPEDDKCILEIYL